MKLIFLGDVTMPFGQSTAITVSVVSSFSVGDGQCQAHPAIRNPSAKVGSNEYFHRPWPSALNDDDLPLLQQALGTSTGI
jgi:hypothetical protein